MGDAAAPAAASAPAGRGTGRADAITVTVASTALARLAAAVAGAAQPAPARATAPAPASDTAFANWPMLLSLDGASTAPMPRRSRNRRRRPATATNQPADQPVTEPSMAAASPDPAADEPPAAAAPVTRLPVAQPHLALVDTALPATADARREAPGEAGPRSAPDAAVPGSPGTTVVARTRATSGAEGQATQDGPRNRPATPAREPAGQPAPPALSPAARPPAPPPLPGGPGYPAVALPAARPVPTGPTMTLVAAMAGLVVLLLAGLALAAARGWFGSGWSAVAGFVGSLVIASLLLVLVARARPLLRRFRGRDELTGLVARRAFLDAAARVVGGAEHRAREATRAALVLVDLNRFREINSVLGHESGDRLLVFVARRLRTLLRPADFAARIGGDEFAVLLRNAGPGRAEVFAARLREALRVPVLLADMPVQPEVSVGIAYAPAHGRGVGELLRHAEAAMDEAKRTRAGQHTYQRHRHAPPGRARLRLRAELRGALEEGQIELRYQPKANPRTGRVAGVEALVRWRHPREGLRGPGVFLPEMEQAGLMPMLTRQVLELALADCAAWRAAGAELSVSVNVPPSVIDDPNFVNVVRDALDRHGLAPSALVVEVTEEALITIRERARSTLSALRGLGVRVSLDDYGTGFCSLAYLHELPADEVKIDQRFLRVMHRDPSAAEIVRSTVSLAHALDLKIVAEGVETRAVWQALASWRCDEVQGYFVSPPLAGGRVLDWLADWSRRVSRRAPAPVVPPSPRDPRPARRGRPGG
ncbi:MAG: bifunctional diguanylate cyclase/phosphodiesterase, partial [Frankia sp.]|nr:bifunctional diguanylate cyclase/phosphodiesterase [Frankia sp.]